MSGSKLRSKTRKYLFNSKKYRLNTRNMSGGSMKKTVTRSSSSSAPDPMKHTVPGTPGFGTPPRVPNINPSNPQKVFTQPATMPSQQTVGSQSTTQFGTLGPLRTGPLVIHRDATIVMGTDGIPRVVQPPPIKLNLGTGTIAGSSTQDKVSNIVSLVQARPYRYNTNVRRYNTWAEYQKMRNAGNAASAKKESAIAAALENYRNQIKTHEFKGLVLSLKIQGPNGEPLTTTVNIRNKFGDSKIKIDGINTANISPDLIQKARDAAMEFLEREFYDSHEYKTLKFGQDYLNSKKR